jgi:hypothetical protein
MKVYIFVWNAGNLVICETVSKETAEKNREWFYQRLVRKSCAVPDFFVEVRRVIEAEQIDLAVIYTIDSGNGSKFHTELLPKEMESMLFSQLVRYKEERTTESGAVRVSAYLRTSQLPRVLKVHDDRSRICKYGDSLLNRVGGAFAFRITFRDMNSVGFLALSLPDSSGTILDSSEERKVKYRRTVTQANNLCVSAALEELWGELGTEAPLTSFIFGDLNYQVNWPDELGKNALRQKGHDFNYNNARKYDELARQLEAGGVLDEYQEGVGGVGPSFPPDYPHVVNRSAECQRSGTCFDYRQGSPAWTSRILYSRAPRGFSSPKCLKYDRIDFGNIRLTPHVGVYGIFELQLNGAN